MKKLHFLIFVLFTLLISKKSQAQTDSAIKPIVQANSINQYNPRKAIIRSAIIPGWGQITNKKAWKVPLVYGALGTTTYLFFRNQIGRAHV